MRSQLAPHLVLLLVALVAVAAQVDVLSLGWCDHDATVLVEVSRVEHPLEVLRFFGQEVRDFVNPETGFYRPWTNVSFALDHALYGLDLTGYHLTDLLLHAMAALLLAALVLELGLPAWVALAVGVWFGAHPLALEVVPSQARRGDTWAVVFLLASCVAWVRAGQGVRGTVLVAVITGLLAPLSKETGVVLPLLWLLLPGPGTWWRRGLAGAALMLVPLGLRTVALGGIGGYRAWTFWPRHLSDAALDLYDPFRLLTGWGAHVMALLMIVTAAALLLRSAGRGRAAVVVGAAWMGALLLLAALARGISAWYLYAPTVGLALVLAGLLAAFDRGLDERAPARPLLQAVVVALLLGPALVGSPLWIDYPEWEEVSDQSARFLEAARVLAAPEALQAMEEGEGRPALVAGIPRVVHLRPRPTFYVRSSHALGDYSVRKGLALLEGRETPVEALAYAHVNEVDADYRILPSWEWEGERWALRLRVEGPVGLWPPAEGALRADGALGTREEGPPWARVEGIGGEGPVDAIVVRDLRAPVWYWNGTALERLAPPPGELPGAP